MSFILDALRKSENQRHRQAGPGLAELRPAMVRPTLPIWAIALAALLAINLVVLAVLMLKDGDSNSPAAATSSVPQVPSPSTNTTPLPADPATSGTTTLPYPDAPERALSSPAPSAYTATESAPTPSDSFANAQDEVEPDAEFTAEEPADVGPELQPPLRGSSANEDENAARLPTIGDVTLQGATVPQLHLDIHVYATQPAERFVFINSRKYREGSETPEGTSIERITRDGVVLNHRGVRFLLPRQ